MNRKVRQKLNLAMEKEAELLTELDPDSVDYIDAVERIDHINNLINSQTNSISLEKYLEMGIKISCTVLPLIFYASWMKQGMEFEKTGTFTSTTFKGLFGKFKPTGV